MKIVRANPDDASALSAIAWTAKAFWGYPAHWMEQWREQLKITPDFIATNETFTANLDRRRVALPRASTGRGLAPEHLWFCRSESAAELDVLNNCTRGRTGRRTGGGLPND